MAVSIYKSRGPKQLEEKKKKGRFITLVKIGTMIHNRNMAFYYHSQPRIGKSVGQKFGRRILGKGLYSEVSERSHFLFAVRGLVWLPTFTLCLNRD